MPFSKVSRSNVVIAGAWGACCFSHACAWPLPSPHSSVSFFLAKKSTAKTSNPHLSSTKAWAILRSSPRLDIIVPSSWSTTVPRLKTPSLIIGDCGTLCPCTFSPSSTPIHWAKHLSLSSPASAPHSNSRVFTGYWVLLLPVSPSPRFWVLPLTIPLSPPISRHLLFPLIGINIFVCSLSFRKPHSPLWGLSSRWRWQHPFRNVHPNSTFPPCLPLPSAFSSFLFRSDSVSCKPCNTSKSFSLCCVLPDSAFSVFLHSVFFPLFLVPHPPVSVFMSPINVSLALLSFFSSNPADLFGLVPLLLLSNVLGSFPWRFLPWKIQEAKAPIHNSPRSDRDLVFVVELSPLASDGPPLASSSPVDDLNSSHPLVVCTVLVGQSRIKHRGRPQSAPLCFFRDWLLLPWLPVWHFPLVHSRCWCWLMRFRCYSGLNDEGEVALVASRQNLC